MKNITIKKNYLKFLVLITIILIKFTKLSMNTIIVKTKIYKREKLNNWYLQVFYKTLITWKQWCKTLNKMRRKKKNKNIKILKTTNILKAWLHLINWSPISSKTSWTLKHLMTILLVFINLNLLKRTWNFFKNLSSSCLAIKKN